ncbi:MAG: efflux RND transporter periplasmic adaptor subunit [Planctomycetota bacterium]|jgi:Cu(I)/Ag(I) efflux system membrane fusion protein
MDLIIERLKQSKNLILIIFISLISGAILHWLLSGSPEGTHHKAAAEKSVVKWTCSMHPQFKLPKPGKCPICYMDLIKLEQGSSDSEERSLALGPNAAKLIELETAEVQRRFVDAEIRMIGKVDYDETRVSYISAWVPGRLDRLFVNYTGIAVRKGDHMVEIYSPDLLNAQEELIQALAAVETLSGSDSGIVRNTASATAAAAKEKLRLMGLDAEQIKKIEKNKKAGDHITINAPVQGIVIDKNAQEGMYVKTGTRIYTIADLSNVWVILDAYESDLVWVKYGGSVEFTTETYPGEIFKGTISFVDPLIDSRTRTARVRVNVKNEKLFLKPGMFVRAIVKAKVADGGLILNSDLQGKWISPMHPEVVKDGPGSCDVCGMALVSAETLGYAAGKESRPPLVIPVSAALKTGKRAVVYKAVYKHGKTAYMGQEVVLGARLGDFYIIKGGLKEGDRIVSRGAFKLDAELQIQAKPSMMTEDEIAAAEPEFDEAAKDVDHVPSEPFEVPQNFGDGFDKFISAYFAIQKSLADDNPKASQEKASSAAETIAEIDKSSLSKDAAKVWLRYKNTLEKALHGIVENENLDKQRESFQQLSDQLIIVVRIFPAGKVVYKASCPMAFGNKGAAWLQENKEILNPYFGEMMLHCGEIQEEINSSGGGN